MVVFLIQIMKKEKYHLQAELRIYFDNLIIILLKVKLLLRNMYKHKKKLINTEKLGNRWKGHCNN